MTDATEILYLLSNRQQWHAFPSSLHGHSLCVYKVCDNAGGKLTRLTLAVRTLTGTRPTRDFLHTGIIIGMGPLVTDCLGHLEVDSGLRLLGPGGLG